MMGHWSDLVIWPILILLPLNLQTRKKWSLCNSKVTHGIFMSQQSLLKTTERKRAFPPCFQTGRSGVEGGQVYYSGLPINSRRRLARCREGHRGPEMLSDWRTGWGGDPFPEGFRKAARIVIREYSVQVPNTVYMSSLIFNLSNKF